MRHVTVFYLLSVFILEHGYLDEYCTIKSHEIDSSRTILVRQSGHCLNNEDDFLNVLAAPH